MGRCVGNRDSGWKAGLAVLGAQMPSCWRAHAFGWNDSVNYKSRWSKKKRKRNKTCRPVQKGTTTLTVSFNDRGQA